MKFYKKEKQQINSLFFKFILVFTIYTDVITKNIYYIKAKI